MAVVDVSSYLADTKRSCSLQSAVPRETLVEECCMGIDEAGRGPVLGPMVYGACFCPLSKKEDVQQLGVADSKTLTEEQRGKLFKAINSCPEILGWKLEVLSSNDISNAMLQRTKYSLNALSHDAAIALIRRALAEGVKLAEVYVDTVGDPGKYQSKLEALFPSLKITVAKKADSIYPIVSAASICAKVARDECLKSWMFVERNMDCGTEFGSGYPSDPSTKAWLSAHLDPVFGYPGVVRFSWATCKEILDTKACNVRWPDDDEENTAVVGCAKINQFFVPKSVDLSKKKHRFYAERELGAVSDL